jgi:hypothetical protein
MERLAESGQNPGVSRKTPAHHVLKMDEYGELRLCQCGRLPVSRVKRKKLMNVLKGG